MVLQTAPVTLDDLGNLGEIVAAVATVATLLYLAVQLRASNQLTREIREGILDPDALDFGGAGQLQLPYYRTSWPLYRPYLGSAFVGNFERQCGLDPTIEVDS